MTSLPQLTEEMRKLAREMLEASQDLELLSQRLGSAQFHKGIVGRPALPAEDASGLEGALDEVGHDILVVVDEIVGWAERAQPFQVRASTATPEEGTTTRYGIVQMPELQEEVDLAVLVKEARVMLKTVNAFSEVLRKGLHHLAEPEVRTLGKSLGHYAEWFRRNGVKLGGSGAATASIAAPAASGPPTTPDAPSPEDPGPN